MDKFCLLGDMLPREAGAEIAVETKIAVASKIMERVNESVGQHKNTFKEHGNNKKCRCEIGVITWSRDLENKYRVGVDNKEQRLQYVEIHVAFLMGKYNTERRGDENV